MLYLNHTINTNYLKTGLTGEDDVDDIYSKNLLGGNATHKFLLAEIGNYNDTFFNHSGLLMGESYGYTLRVKNSLCEGPPSATVTYRTAFDVP